MASPPRQPGALEVRLSLEGMPETLAGIRREMARVLRDVADDEPPAVSARLRQIADDFETGVSSE